MGERQLEKQGTENEMGTGICTKICMHKNNSGLTVVLFLNRTRND